MTFKYSDGATSYGFNDAYTTEQVTEAYYDKANWDPDYHGNLLYTFSDPEPIFIDNTPVGDMMPVAAKDATAPQGYSVSDLNNYLGSYNADNTIVLCIREQTQTTDEIRDLFGLTGLTLMEDIISGDNIIEVDSANATNTGTVPDSDNLKNTAGGNEPDGGMDTGESDNPMGEFNMDMNVALPSLNFQISDYITVIINGYEVGFSIGMPLLRRRKPGSIPPLTRSMAAKTA